MYFSARTIKSKDSTKMKAVTYCKWYYHGILAVIAVGALVYMGPKIKAMFDKSGSALDQGKG